MIEKQLARTGQPRAARCPGEQHHAQFFFQFLDGPRQRRLLDMQSPCRAGDVEFFGHGQEAAKMAQLHREPPLVPRLVHAFKFSSIERHHRHQEWLEFLKKINRETPKHLQLHLIVDNYATHKHPKVRPGLRSTNAFTCISPRPPVRG